MSDELQIITTNAASDGWVDGVPGAVSTGYQAQNTALQALFNGVDKSSCSVSGANLVIAAGGLIDDSGLPFVITEAITLTLPTTGAANWFLRVVPGSTALERSIEFTDDRGTYDAAKNGFYDGDGYRVLNWCYERYTKAIVLTVENANQVGSAEQVTKQQAFPISGRVMPGLWGSCKFDIAISGGVTCKGLAYYGGYLYNLGDNVQKYALDGTLVDTITVGALSRHTCSTIDPTTGNLVRIKDTDLGGGIPSPHKTEAVIYSGISSTVLSTVTIIASAGFVASACVIDSDGNLIIFNNTAGYTLGIRVHAGITSTLTTSFAGDADCKKIAWDFYNKSILAFEIDTTPETEMPRITRYSGNTSTVQARAALPSLFEYITPLAFCNNVENGECAACFSTTIMRLGAF